MDDDAKSYYLQLLISFAYISSNACLPQPPTPNHLSPFFTQSIARILDVLNFIITFIWLLRMNKPNNAFIFPPDIESKLSGYLEARRHRKANFIFKGLTEHDVDYC
jgi:hypothetical protein